jgi:hypothetical protein
MGCLSGEDMGCEIKNGIWEDVCCWIPVCTYFEIITILDLLLMSCTITVHLLISQPHANLHGRITRAC